MMFEAFTCDVEMSSSLLETCLRTNHDVQLLHIQ